VGGLPGRFAEVTHFSGAGHVQMEEVRVTEEIFPLETSVRLPTYGGGVAAGVDQAEPDELDIPAFLRRGN
jgi:cell division protein FtsZ